MTNTTANINCTAFLFNRTAQRLERRFGMSRTQETDLPIGDGKAKVGQTRGFSHWYSTREAGMTVKAESHVTLTCGQSGEEISAALDEAGRIAESTALQSIEEMGIHLDNFVEETK